MLHVKDKIKQQLKNNKTIIYMKGTPEKPLCGYSAQSIYILNLLDIKYTYINILEEIEIRKELPLYSNWPTFPQLYYKEELIGGTDIMCELYKQNKLKNILTK